MSAPVGATTSGQPRRFLPLRIGSALPAVLAAAAVLTQISYPLLTGTWLRTATIAAVLLFATASLTDAGRRFGIAAAAGVLLVAGGIGLFAEAVGVATGVPFGSYRYSQTLGPALLGVPLLVPLAWTMMAYPCLLLGRRIARRADGGRADGGRADGGRAGASRRAVTVLTGAGTLAGWDLYLDPQMVAAGHWIWSDPSPALPGVPQIPLTNYAGWLLVAAVMIAVLDRTVPGRTVPDLPVTELVPAALLAWTWIGSAVGNLVFFDRPAVAGYGAIAMGVCSLPYLMAVGRDQIDRHGRRAP
jgi:putative membrane protein